MNPSQVFQPVSDWQRGSARSIYNSASVASGHKNGTNRVDLLRLDRRPQQECIVPPEIISTYFFQGYAAWAGPRKAFPRSRLLRGEWAFPGRSQKDFSLTRQDKPHRIRSFLAASGPTTWRDRNLKIHNWQRGDCIATSGFLGNKNADNQSVST
jgi:hypothetical protein